MATKKTTKDADAKPLSKDDILASMQKKYGNDAPFRADQWVMQKKEQALYIPLTNDAFNIKTNGGILHGNIVEITGPYSSGKSLLTWDILINAQKEGLLPVLVETEGRLTEQTLLKMEANGLDLENLWLARVEGNNPNKLFPQIIDIIKHKVPMILAIDSLMMIVPEIDTNKAVKDDNYYTKRTPGGDAQVYSRFIKDIVAATVPSLNEPRWCTILYVNHGYLKIDTTGRMDINRMPKEDRFVNKGGEALKYGKTMEINVWKSHKPINEETRIPDVSKSKYEGYGWEMGLTIKKSRHSREGEKVVGYFYDRDLKERNIRFGMFDKYYSMVKMAMEYGVVTAPGGRYQIKDKSIFWKDIPDYFEKNPNIYEWLKKEVTKVYTNAVDEIEPQEKKEKDGKNIKKSTASK